jgi:hypothetical protein
MVAFLAHRPVLPSWLRPRSNISLVRRYTVAFDGRKQGRFADLDDALGWGKAVGDTGRLVYVWQGFLRAKLIAIFPEEMEEEGQRLWKRGRIGASSGDLMAGVPPAGGF